MTTQTEIETTNRIDYHPLVDMIVNGMTSPHTQRAYGDALVAFLRWIDEAKPDGFTRATVQAYKV